MTALSPRALRRPQVRKASCTRAEAAADSRPKRLSGGEEAGVDRRRNGLMTAAAPQAATETLPDAGGMVEVGLMSSMLDAHRHKWIRSGRTPVFSARLRELLQWVVEAGLMTRVLASSPRWPGGWPAPRCR